MIASGQDFAGGDMRIVMVGPVYPFKGGIAHYTGLMSNNLAREHEVFNVSFSMQYPKIMYKHEQKDFRNDSFRTANAEYMINTINPISWIRTVRHIRRLEPDLVIFSWWHPFFSPSFGYLARKLKAGCRVFFLCHNVLPHEGFPMKHFFCKHTLKHGDVHILHTTQDADDLKGLLENPKYYMTPHPTYNVFKMQNMPRQKARQILEINEHQKVLLFFGFIREYKGLRHLLRAMPALLEKYPDMLLYVVGDFFEHNKESYLDMIRTEGIEKSVRLYDGYTPDKEVEKFFAASDLVVLPYESATQSGIVQIAYGFEKPVVATNVGGLPEVVLDRKTGFLVPPKDPKALSSAIIEALSADTEAISEHIRQEAFKYSWDRMNEIVERAMEELH